MTLIPIVLFKASPTATAGLNMPRFFSQIERELSKSNRLAPFPSALERSYQADIHVARQRHLILCLILGTVSFNGFLIWKLVLGGDDFLSAAVQMLATSIPCATLVIVLLIRLSVRWRESVALVPSYLGLIVAYNVVVNGSRLQEMDELLFIFCWPLMLIYVNTCMQSPFKIALRFNVFALALTAWAIYHEPISLSVAGLMLTAMTSSAFFSLLGNYWANNDVRRSYLYRLRERKRSASLSDANHDLQRLSETDSLTGLANRRQVQPQLDQLRADCISGKADGAVLLVDIDHFKRYNDYYGHLLGDECLKKVASMLKASMRPQDIIARFGGEEFVIVLPETEQETAHKVATALLHNVRSLEIPHLGRTDGTFVITISVGVSHSASVELTDSSAMLDQADRALYRAKRDGRNRIEHAGCMRALGNDFLLTPEDIRRALANDEFELHFQPLYQIDPYMLIGYEALIRWHHPTFGAIPTDKFITIAERSGLISAVGYWVLQHACSEARNWPDNLIVSVNLSPLQLIHSDFPVRVAGVLAKTGLKGSSLQLEITEGEKLDLDEQLKNSVGELVKLGVLLALDDFGQGHANVAYLLQLSFHVVKIDRQALKITDPLQRYQVLQALLALGHAFGLKVLAEGVETAHDLALLEELGFDQAQGYFLGRPQAIVTDVTGLTNV